MFRTESAGPTRPARAGACPERLARAGGPSLELLVHRPAAPSGRAPVLFLHGAFAGAWCWEEGWLGAVAGSGRHAAALSLRGHGGSEGREALWRTGLPDFADDLLLAIRAMPAPPVLVAHSIGGLLAQHLLAPALAGQVALRGLVLVGSLPPEGLALIGPWLGLTAWVEAAAGPAGLGRAGRFDHPDAMFGIGIEPALAAAYAARLGTGSLMELCLGSFTSLAQAYVPLPVLPAAAAGLPALVLHGAEDRLVDSFAALRTALYHGAAFESVAGAGHCPMLGPQAEAAAAALLGWLDRACP